MMPRHLVILALCALAAAVSCDQRPAIQPGGGGSLQGPVTAVPDLDGELSCGADEIAALKQCVERQRLEADVVQLAKPRPPGSAQHSATRRLCQQRLKSLGYEVEVQDYGTGKNVIGVKPGFSKADELVVVSAHYDNLKGCAGADDNASGLAVVLEAARVLIQARFDRSVVIACWDEAERGQLGSAAYAQRAHEMDRKIIAAMIFESVGFSSDKPDSQTIPEGFEQLFPDLALTLLDNEYRGDFLTVVTDQATQTWADAMVRHGKDAALSVHVLTLRETHKAKRRELHRSDHMSFWDAEYPALLLTDTAGYRNPRVHCKHGQDSPDSLDYDFIWRTARSAVGVIVELLQLR